MRSIQLLLATIMVACTTAPTTEPGSMPGSPDPEAFMGQIESFVAKYVDDGVDLSSSGLPMLCEEGRESCRSDREDVQKRCVAACERYRRAAEQRAGAE